MRQSNQVDKLCIEIMNSNHNNMSGLSYYPQFTDKLRQYSSTDVILAVMRNCDFQTARELIMSTPFLWTSLGTADWIYIMENAIRRVPRLSHDENADFVDLFILSRYFQLDALTFFITQTGANLETKNIVYSVFYRFGPLLCYNRLDLDDLDGIYLTSKSIVESTASRLVREGKFKHYKVLNKNIDTFLIRIKHVLDNMKNKDQ